MTVRCRRRLAVPLVAALAVVIAATHFPQARASETVLDNGLRVILLPHHANPMIASSVLIGAGVVHEPPEAVGASHLLEHLLFNGTERRTQRQLYDEVDLYGAYNNATTREDHTLFSLLIHRDFAARGLDIQADMLFHSTIPEENFGKETRIVLEELARDRSDPAYDARQAFRAFAWAGTPLARPVLGTEESIGAIARDTVVSYHAARYVPGNMTLVLMGDFDETAILETVRATFGREPAAAPPAPVVTSWPPRPERNFRTMALDAPRVYLHAGFPLGLAPSDPEFEAVELLLDALTSGEDAPLRAVLRSGASPPTLEVSLGASARTVPWTTVELDAVLPEGGDPAAVLALWADGLRSLGAGSAARDRLDSVREAARADEVLTADRIHYYAMTRSSRILGSPAGWLEGREDRLAGIDPALLDRAARRIVERLGDARILAAGAGLADGEATWSPPPAPDAAPARKASRVARRLDNGLVLSVARNEDSDVFAAHLMFRPRSASEPEGKEGIADLLHRLFLRGTVVHDREALSARLDALGAQVKTHDAGFVPYDDYYTTPEFSFVRLEMPSDRWREGIAALGEIVRFPAIGADDVEAVRAEMLDLVSRDEASSRAVGSRLLDRTLAPAHPESRPVSGTEASLRAIGVDDLRAFHRDYVTGRRAVITVVGPVDAEAVAGAIERTFGDLPAGPETRPVPPASKEPPSRSAAVEVGGDQSWVALASLIDVVDDDLPALEVATAILSDRLAFDLRETKGLAYAIGAGVGPFAGRTRFRAAMGTRPENVEAAVEGLRDGIAAFLDGAVASGEVERAANAARGRSLLRRLTRLQMAYAAAMDLLEGNDPGASAQRIEAMGSVTAGDVLRVARRYLRPAAMTTIVAK